MNIDGKEVVVGMTTCPRDGVSYIEESIASLTRNRWGFPLIYDDKNKRGDWWGFLKVVKLLLEAYPAADRLVVVQDDVVACGTPLDLVKLGTFDCDLLSLFTTSSSPEKWCDSVIRHCHTNKPSVDTMRMKIGTKEDRLFACDGGIAYSMSRQFAGELLEVATVKWTPTPQRLGEECDILGYGYHLSTRNLFEHIGEESSLHPDKPGYKWDISKSTPYRKGTK
jgi:hypothetical protein